jgi:hypothetical protein
MLQRLLKIQKGEGFKVLQFILLGGLLQAGVAIGVSAADSLFLVNVGPSRLPIVYLITPVIMLIYISVYTYLISRYQIDRVFYLTLGVLAAGGVGLFFLGQFHHPILYYGMKFYSILWVIGLYTLFWNFTDSYYEIQDAKRLFPLFSGGASTGAMLGGGMVTVLSRYIHVEAMYLAWAFLALLTFPVIATIRKHWKVIESDEDSESQSFFNEIRETGRFMRRNNFIKMLIIVSFLSFVLTTIIELQYSSIFIKNPADPTKALTDTQLANLFGTLFAAVSVFNLILNYFFFNRMVLRFGVGNVALITPLFYIAAFMLLLFNPGFPAAIFGFFAYQGILTSVDWNNGNFLYNAIPSFQRKKVRTFVEGLSEPLATAVAGGFLLLFGTTIGYVLLTGNVSKKETTILPPETISAIGLIGGMVYFILALILRSSYLKAMVQNMKSGWLDFSRPVQAALSGLDDEQMSRLEEQATTGDREMANTVIRILWENDRMKGLKAYLRYISNVSDEEQAASRPLLEMILHDDDPEINRHLLDWLDANDYQVNANLLQELGNHGLIRAQDLVYLSHSSDPEERAALLIAAWNSWNIEDRLQAMQGINALMKGDEEDRIAFIRVLGRSSQERNAYALAPLLEDPHPEIRKEALLAITRLATPNSSRLIPALLRAMEKSDSEGRIAGMDALIRIADSNCVRPLLALSDAFSPFERRHVESVLFSIGLKSVPATLAVLRDLRYSYRTRSIAARALAKLAFPQLEAISPQLIETEMRRAYECLYYFYVLNQAEATHPSQPHPFKVAKDAGYIVLSRFYKDTESVIVDFILELLTLGGRLPNFELISSSLRSTSSKDRGNAIETIEQAVSREIFRLLLPLVDARGLAEKVAFYKTRMKGPDRTADEIVEAALDSNFPLECCAAVQVLWETAPDRAAERLRKRMHESQFDLLKETAFSLLDKAENAASMNLIEKMACLAQSPFFDSFPLQGLEIAARHATLVQFPAGETLYRVGDPSDDFFLLLSGEVTLDAKFAEEQSRLDGDILRPVRKMGDTVGEEAVLGQSTRMGTAHSQGVAALRIEASFINAAARSQSTVAVGLLNEKMKVLRAA